MLVMVKHPENWLSRARELQQAVLPTFSTGDLDTRVFKRGELGQQLTQPWALVRVVSGLVGLTQQGNRVLALEAGDCWLGYPGSLFDWYQEGAVELEIWTWSKLTSETIAQTIHGFNDLLFELINHSAQVPPDPTPGFEFFKSGDIIIQEGDPADSVYTLIQGKAKVIIGGVTVGIAKEHEILGLQAMLLKTHRTASVIADGPCSAVKVTYDKFRSLIETRPELVLSTMETMAQQIERANKRLTEE